ncbi:amidohydrolase family protein [Halalkalibacter akibai]|uniref:5-methylthioadenosine/S-adenosylhomocysteine deaminase n=1 Tax=Halalkalibacter akibai (strain ATCC 43226 / DSM 21942 / CIP 109018 / JCM 9157 / 1139) TaxID=1236973 RepID=W4QSG2_HALA3|nr:amidohydrolase [Halalkalibacter akibai]GAE35055.1 S-adenosylhomocysteine deaminase [Halalkalibacter akibai JCM 9157]
MSKKIIINGTIITMDVNNLLIKDGAVAFENGEITYVGETPNDLTTYTEVIDVKGDYVIPGLINTHGHASMSLLRGYADDLPLQQWLEEKMWPIEATYTKEHAKWGTNLSIIEMLRTGTTTFVDMYDNMDEVAMAVDKSGIRARLCRGMIGFGSEELRQSKLDEASNFVRNWSNQANGRITTMMSPHSPYTCTPDFIEKIVSRAVELNSPLHIHMSETKAEVELNVKEYGERPVKHLEKLGMFHQPTLVAHAVHVEDWEMDILAEYDVKVSNNIISNLKLASGIAPVPEMLNKGITVSLGTDSSASNNNLDLFEELKQVALLYKGVHNDATLIPAEKALQLATIHGAEAIWLDHQVGSIEVGKQADLVVINTKQAFYQPAHNPISHLVYSGSGRDVKDVYVQGKQVVKNGQCVTIDEEMVIFEVNRLSKQF